MRRYVLKRFYLDLNMQELTDDDRDQLVAAIQQMASTSALIQGDPAMKASVTAIDAKATKLKTDRDTVASSEQKLEADIDTANQSREALDLEILTLAGMVTTRAKTAADVTGAGFVPRPPPPPKPPFAPPDAIAIRFPKREKGKFIASPEGSEWRTWVVQMSADPYGPTTWVDVVGTGKTRTITGASGSRVWVRYAMVRGGEQSAFGTPVLVTIP